MRTSKVANDTQRYNRVQARRSLRKDEKEVETELTQRQTRSFAQRLKGFGAPNRNAATVGVEAGGEKQSVSRRKRGHGDGDEMKKEVKEEDGSDLSSLLSSSENPGLGREDGVRKRYPVRRGKTKTITKSNRESSYGCDESPQAKKRKKTIKTEEEEESDDDLHPTGQVKIHSARARPLPPPRWREVYETMREMRSKIVAPVDTMGCEQLADKEASPRDQRFQTLLSLMLSSQTKDTTTSAVMRQLQTTALIPHPPGLTLETILDLPDTVLNELIQPVGFHNVKTRSIKRTAEKLRDEHSSDIPRTVAGLMSLPGVGPKMAYLCSTATAHTWPDADSDVMTREVEGIGVDTHVMRITRRWGWHDEANVAAEKIRLSLQSWLPRDEWRDINRLLVGFGQVVCRPVGRRCGVCEVGRKGLCPSSSSSLDT